MLLYLGFALLGGFLLANQSPINTDLRDKVGSPFLAASLSNAVGSVFLGLLSLALGGGLLPSPAFIGANPWWIWTGGLCGGVFLTSTVLLFPRLGAVQTVILPIFGQIVTGMAIDSYGWFDAPRIPFGPTRLTGLLVGIIGVLVTVLVPGLHDRLGGQRSQSARPQSTKGAGGLAGWRAWAVFIGGLAAVQQAVNGRLGTLLQNPTQAAFISFVVGLLEILLVALSIDKRLPFPAQLRQSRPWDWLGGLLGGLFVLANAFCVPRIGAGLTIMMGLVGQVLGGMLVQNFGWWRSARRRVQAYQVIGVAVMLLGVVIIKFV